MKPQKNRFVARLWNATVPLCLALICHAPASYAGVTTVAVMLRGGGKIAAQSEQLISVEATRILPVRSGGVDIETNRTSQREARACLRTLVSPSCAARKRARSACAARRRGLPEISSPATRPAVRHSTTSASRASGNGRSSAGEARSEAMDRRTSARPSRARLCAL